uniref:Uncharacterized protein n=1 Tax=Sinocyclocheilus anshuiensis TaxID=1608454 RepID=A0A671N7J8_9TELE
KDPKPSICYIPQDMPQERDPFPFSRYENDYTLTGSEEIQKLPYDKPTHLAQNNEPWRRLRNTTTQASSSLIKMLILDENFRRHLEAIYIKTVLYIHKQTQTEQHECYLAENKGMRVWVDTQKASIYSNKGVCVFFTLESHHTHDGGFYST